MNRINPLYIASLLAVVIIFLIFQLRGVRTGLSEAKESFAQTTNMAIELSSLKKVYAKEVNLAVFNSKSLVKTTTKTGLTISAKEIDAPELNILMGKLLNGTYNIKALKLKKISDTKASLHLEIKW